MRYIIDDDKIEEFTDIVSELSKLLDERIDELYKVKRMQQCRHAYVFYRKLLWNARDIVGIEEKEE